jgi:class 3 adenylate cyclase
MASQVLTIMLTDIQGFTEKTSASSREALVKLITAHEELLIPILGKFNGTLIKTIGDALLATFPSPTDAVLCGLMMQQKLFEYNQAKDRSEWIQIRIAINTGEVELIQGDIFGEAVNITARIEGITEANEIYFTEAVYLSMNKSEVPTSEVGYRLLKGIPEEIKVFRVIQDRDSEDFRTLMHKLDQVNLSEPLATKVNTETGLNTKTRRFPKLLPIILIGAIFLGGGIYLFLKNSTQRAYDQITEALSSHQLDLARNRAEALFQEHATEEIAINGMKEVVRAQGEELYGKGKYLQAIELVDHAATQYSLDMEDIALSLYLKWGESTLDKIHWSKSREIYARIFHRFPRSESGLKSIINVLGKVGKGWEERLLISAALSYSGLVSPPYDQELLSALLIGLNESPDTDMASSVRAVFIANPEVKAILKDKLKTREEFPRINTYIILNERKQLTEEELREYHVINFFTGRSRTYQRESIDWITLQSQRTGWNSQSDYLDGINISKSRILKRNSGSFFEAAHKAVIAGFLPELMNLLVTRANFNPSAQSLSVVEENDRLGSFQILNKAGKTDQVDLFNFHATTLVSYDPQYRMEYFDNALSFLKGQWGKGRDEWIRKTLLEGIDYTATWIEHRKSLGAENLPIAEGSLNAINSILNELK